MWFKAYPAPTTWTVIHLRQIRTTSKLELQGMESSSKQLLTIDRTASSPRVPLNEKPWYSAPSPSSWIYWLMIIAWRPSPLCTLSYPRDSSNRRRGVRALISATDKVTITSSLWKVASIYRVAGMRTQWISCQNTQMPWIKQVLRRQLLRKRWLMGGSPTSVPMQERGLPSRSTRKNMSWQLERGTKTPLQLPPRMEQVQLERKSQRLIYGRLNKRQRN